MNFHIAHCCKITLSENGETVFFGPVFAASLFIIGWTSYSRITPWAPLVGVGMNGAACIGLFLPLMNYVGASPFAATPMPNDASLCTDCGCT